MAEPGARVCFERQGAVGHVVLEHPPLNLFGAEVLDDLEAAVEEARRAEIRALVVRAEGKVFTGGVDVNMFDGLSPQDARELALRLFRLSHAVEDLPFPTVACVGATHALVEERAHHPLGGRVGPRRAGGKPLGEASCALEELGLGHNAVDDVPELERRRLEEAAAHHQLARPGRAGTLGHALGPAHERRDPDHDLHQAEAGRLGGPDQIAGERELEAGGEAEAVLAVLDDAGLERPHVIGASMGGMIVQHLALAHAERLQSLTLQLACAPVARAVSMVAASWP